MSSSIPLDSVHHIEDVGHLLLEAQQELARVRQKLDALPLESTTGGIGGTDSRGSHASSSNGTTNSSAIGSLRSLLTQTESSLRSKAEAIVRSIEDNKINTLPPLNASGTVAAGHGASGGLNGSATMKYEGDFNFNSVIATLSSHNESIGAGSGLFARLTSPSPTRSSSTSLSRSRSRSLLSPSASTLSSTHHHVSPNPSPNRRPGAERMSEGRIFDFLSRSGAGGTGTGSAMLDPAREYIHEKYGLDRNRMGTDPPPPPQTLLATLTPQQQQAYAAARKTGGRPIEKYGSHWRETRVIKGPRSHARVLPRQIRDNPRAFPSITAEDAAGGLLNLVQKGFLPPFVDVGSALHSAPSPLRSSPAKFHDATEVRMRSGNMPPAMHSNFDLGAVKLDLGAALMDPELHAYEREQELEAERRLLQVQGQGGQHEEEEEKHADYPRLMPATDESNALDADLAREAEDERRLEEELRREHEAVEAIADRLDAQALAGPSAATGSARDYDTLLDAYSLHHLLLRKGKFLTSTPEFISFARLYREHWGAVKVVLQALEELAQRYRIGLATIDGSRVYKLAEEEHVQLTPEILFSCFVMEMESSATNSDDSSQRRPVDPVLLSLLRSPIGVRYRMGGDLARSLAALKIQSTYRMFVQRRLYLLYRFRSAKATVIQRAWRRWKTIQHTRQHIAENWSRKLEAWRSDIQSKWKESWKTFQKKKRVLLHVPSMSMEPYQRQAMFNFAVRENSQLSRLCDVMDPLVDVVYCSPFMLSPDVQSYYMKLLEEVGGIASVSSRVKILVPDQAARLPDHFSLAKLLLYSPKALRAIRAAIRGRPVVMVPGQVGSEDLALAVELGVPLWSGEPDVVQVFGSKSGSKRIFAAADVSVPPGAHDIYDVHDLYAYLAKLMVDNLNVSKWFFKIDNESGGRGLAWLESSSIRLWNVLREEYAAHESRWQLPEVLASAQERLVVALRKHLPSRVHLAASQLYDGKWSNFATVFFRMGGIIEAAPSSKAVLGSPSVNLLIDPDGSITCTSSHDQVFTKSGVFGGAQFPSSAPCEMIHAPALAIARQCFKEGIIGYIGVDFVVWNPNHPSNLSPNASATTLHEEEAGAHGYTPPIVWAVDLNLRMTSSQSSFILFNFLMRGRYVYTTIPSKSDPTPLHLRPPAKYLVTVGRGTTSNGIGAAGTSSVSASSSLLSSRASSRPSSGSTTPKLPDINDPSSSPLSRMSTASSSISSSMLKSTSSLHVKERIREEERFYTCINYLYQPHLATVPFGSFFNLCRMRGLHFDIRSRVGTAFQLLDSLASGTIGLICVGLPTPPIGGSIAAAALAASFTSSLTQPSLAPPHHHSSPLHALQLMVDALSFLNDQLSSLKFGPHLYDEEANLQPLLLAFKQLLKAQREAIGGDA